REKRYVIEHLDELVVRRVSAARSLLGPGQDNLVRPDMTPAERAQLVAAIERSGYDFVGQESVPLSTAPVWSDSGALTAAPIALRVYVAATAQGYEVMPGALARVAQGSNPRAAWLEAGDLSKDAWVLSDQPVEQF